MNLLKSLSVLAGMLLSALLFCPDASAQFRDNAFSQQYNSDSSQQKDSADTMFSFKEYFGGLKHQNELKIGTAFAGSAVFIGGMQIYNKQSWKLPIVYSTIGGSLGAGIYLNSTGKHDAAKWCFVGAGVAYWGTLMDGVISYRPNDFPHHGKATLYSLLVPGLGQIYNKEYWKLPIYLGLMGFSVHYYTDCAKNYNRFNAIYREAQEQGSSYQGPVTSDQALYYRNLYRRYRDYSLLAIAAVYLLQVIDANVFSYMHNFEVAEDLAMKVAPTVIMPDNQFASVGGTGQSPAVGLKLGFSF